MRFLFFLCFRHELFGRVLAAKFKINQSNAIMSTNVRFDVCNGLNLFSFQFDWDRRNTKPTTRNCDQVIRSGNRNAIENATITVVTFIDMLRNSIIWRSFVWLVATWLFSNNLRNFFFFFSSWVLKNVKELFYDTHTFLEKSFFFHKNSIHINHWMSISKCCSFFLAYKSNKFRNWSKEKKNCSIDWLSLKYAQ